VMGVGPEEDPLDRYAVTEVMCMQCNTLQPAEDRCINSECESNNRPFAKYFCRICHLYDDDGSRAIFHCPYCNTCRLGLGLGIDFRHCMRCNACVSLDDKEHHCIPQKLQGSCPICHDSLFQSTEPLRGLNCGHVMHMKCFTEYRRRSYTCPLCMRCMEDMKDHFALLDTAVRMQPMPASFLNTKSNIYCQDCGKTSQVQYHFVGQKCFHCSSYNTREMGRVSTAPT
jgi:Zinc-ribbon/Ring finger domain